MISEYLMKSIDNILSLGSKAAPEKKQVLNKSMIKTNLHSVLK
jgi:hypothetical protein